MPQARIEESHNHSVTEDAPRLSPKWLCLEIAVILLIFVAAIPPAWILLRWDVSFLVRILLLIIDLTLLLLAINRAIPIATVTVRLLQEMIVTVIEAWHDIRDHTEKRRIKVRPEPLDKVIIVPVELDVHDIERMQEILNLLGDAIRADMQEGDEDPENSHGCQ